MPTVVRAKPSPAAAALVPCLLAILALLGGPSVSKASAQSGGGSRTAARTPERTAKPAEPARTPARKKPTRPRPVRPRPRPPCSAPGECQQAIARSPEELLAAVAKARRLSVVVRLNADRDARGRARPHALEAAQKALQQGLSGTGFRVKRLFRHVPFATLEVDALALRKLLDLKVVAGVSQEKEFRPLLDESTNVVDASAPFKQTFSGAGAAVAIIDGGTASHSFLGNRLVEEFCFSSPGWDATSLCRDGASEDSGPGAACAIESHCDHGTHVAGIAAGDGGSRSGIAREADIIAINASVMKTPFLAGSYDTFLLGDLVASLEKVLDLTEDRTIAAVNMSLGWWAFAEGSCDTHSENERAMKEVVDLLRDERVATVASAGNAGEPNKMGSPACISSVISVGATDKSAVVAEFSDSSNQLDFLAPGVDITSSVVGGFDDFDGTSMAAPHVTGAWAVLKAEKPDATVDEIATLLRDSGRAITDERQGRVRPLIQVEGALQLLLLPEVRIYPANGMYQSPLEVQVEARDRLGVNDLKIWATTNGDTPEEGAAGTTLVCEGPGCTFDYNTVTLEQEGAAVVSAKAFFTRIDGARVPSRTAANVYWLLEPEPGPATVQASDGAFPDRIRITWTAVPETEGYDVFASLRADDPERLAWKLNTAPLTETTFDHVQTTFTGEVLHYFVRGEVDGFPTLFGGPDTGYAQVAAIPVTATDGTDPQGIRLSWDPTPWKTPGLHVVYEVYRGSDTSSSQATLIATREGTFINNFPAGIVVEPASREYLDTDVTPNQTYYYWVKGIDGSDVSRLGDGESGRFAGP